MSCSILVVGNDPHVHTLIVDILEITLRDSVIEKSTSIQEMFTRLKKQPYRYDLVVLDLQNDKNEDEVLILNLRNTFPHLTGRLILLLEKSDEKPGDAILRSIPCVTKPFSLDEFGCLVKTICPDKE